MLPIVLSLWLVLTYPPSLFKLLSRVEEDGAIPIALGEETFETLTVKVYYASGLAGVMGKVRSEAQGDLSKTIIGEFLRIRWQNETVEVAMINGTEHVFNLKELKKEEKQLKLSLGDSPIDLTIRVLNLSYPRLRNLPEDFKKRIITTLENQPFTKWLREEGFTYSVESVRLWGALGDVVITSNVEIELLVEGVEASCSLTLNKTYRIDPILTY
ncbi:MAG: hypothetical protein N3F08_02315 [Crenarchaeota archaeon]|nr:hypothetical protein [Thermoproteota archaeon]